MSHLRILIHQNHQISFHHSTLLFIDERLFVQYFLSFAWYFQKEDYLIFEFIDDLSSMMSFTLQEIKTLYQRTFAVPSYIIQISWHTWINKVIKSASILKFSLNNCNVDFEHWFFHMLSIYLWMSYEQGENIKIALKIILQLLSSSISI